jgi:phage gp36-like protein
MPQSNAVTPLASAARTTSGVGAAVDLGAATTLSLTLDVEAASGSLTVHIETASSETAATWTEVAITPVVTSVGEVAIVAPGCKRWARIRWDLSGSFTFGVAGDALIVYATPARIKNVINALALVKEQAKAYTDIELDEFAQDATDDADAHLANVFTLPLVAWGRDIERHTAELAAYYAVKRRGYPADDQQGGTIRAFYKDAMDYFENVRDAKIDPPGVVDSTPDVEDGGAHVVCNPSRGWGLIL